MLASFACETRILSKLSEKHAADRSQILSARLESEFSARPLVDLLVEHDLISEEDVAVVYAEAADLRFLDLSRRSPSRVWALLLPENVARSKDCLAFGEVGGQLVVAVADPIDRAVRQSVEVRFDRPIQYVVSPRYQIRAAHDQIYTEARAQGSRMVDNVPLTTTVATVSATGLNVVEQLDSIMDEAVDRRASDIHFESEQDRMRVRYRIDGRLIEARAYPLELAPSVISRIKVLSGMDITERRKGQDGRFSHRSFDQEIDVRVAVIPTARGERATLRLFSQARAKMTLAGLGMGMEIRQAFERLIHRPHGIILITGPTGSGKSTTLYGALQVINSIDKHIITIEDPVEYDIPGVNQVAVNSEFGVSFPSALRGILRHDPDIIMVGEIRDEETAHLALEASLTGHLVFATLHTNSAVGAVTRLLDMGCEPYLVASALIGIMAQRLVRKICVNCRKTYPSSAAERRLLGLPEDQLGVELYRGAGCTRCLRSGYYDRLGVFEFVLVDPGLSTMVVEKASTEELHRYAIGHGAITLKEDAFEKVRGGLTSLEEALRVVSHDLL